MSNTDIELPCAHTPIICCSSDSATLTASDAESCQTFLRGRQRRSHCCTPKIQIKFGEQDDTVAGGATDSDC